MRTNIIDDEISENQLPPFLPNAVGGQRRAALDFALACGEELDDASLLETILYQHFSEPTAGKIAKRLLRHFNDLTGVLNSNMQQLLDVGDLTLCAAASIVRVKHLSTAVTKASIRGRTIFRCHQEILEYCKAILSGAEREEFHALFFDRGGELAGQCCLQRGTIDHVSVYPREVLRKVIDFNASYTVLVHNHPFGKARPSNADVAMTRQLASLTEAVGATVYDHIIVSADETFSFREACPSGLHATKRSLPLSR